jgi:DNA-binding NarL/FixJ family response regulator
LTRDRDIVLRLYPEQRRLRQEGAQVPRVLVCDQLPIVRDGLRTILDAETDIEVVESTNSGIHSIILARQLRPDVILTGLTLDGIGGLEMIRRLQREELDPQPRFVVLTMNDSEEQLDDVLNSKVNGVLLKDVTREELSSAVRAAARGQTTLAPQIAQRLVDWYRTGRNAQQDEPARRQLDDLTRREYEVLLLVARGRSAEEAARELAIGVATVRTHLYRLRCKLDLRDRAQLVSFAYRAGLMQQPAAPTVSS